MKLTTETKYWLLLEIAQKVRDTLDLDVILEHILDSVQTVIPYDAAGIFVLNRDLKSLEYGSPRQMIAGLAQRGFKVLTENLDPMLSEGKGIIGRVIQTAESFVVDDVRSNPYYVIGREETKSEIAVPIIINNRVVGALNVESDRLAAFDESDLEVLQFFADSAAISIERTVLHQQILEKELLEKQLQTARDVQQRLFPEGSPGIPGYAILGLCIPTEEVGGDYFDYIQLPRNQLGLAVADVSGHGISSALVMTAFRALLRTHSHSRSRPARIAQTINRQLPEFTGDQHFVTVFYAVMHPDDGLFEYVCCGHPPPVLLRSDGRIEYLDRHGPALGIFREPDYPTGVTRLNPGDLVALYTDGVVEVENSAGERFGSARLVQSLQKYSQHPMDNLTEAVVQETQSYAGSSVYRDDFTLVLIKRMNP